MVHHANSLHFGVCCNVSKLLGQPSRDFDDETSQKILEYERPTGGLKEL